MARPDGGSALARGGALGGGGALSDLALEEVAARLGELPLVDVRALWEYDGTSGKPCDPRQGHIPGASHLELARLLELTAAELEAALGVPAGTELGVYCHSGSRSAFAVRVLRTAGYEARNYPGSWHEWSRRHDLPIER